MNTSAIWHNACKPTKPHDVEVWDKFIDDFLTEWGRGHVSANNPPNPSAIKLAGAVAVTCKNAGWEAPTRVIVDDDGSIIFEHKLKEYFQTLSVKSDGAIILDTFKDWTLQNTHTLELNTIGKR